MNRLLTRLNKIAASLYRQPHFEIKVTCCPDGRFLYQGMRGLDLHNLNFQIPKGAETRPITPEVIPDIDAWSAWAKAHKQRCAIRWPERKGL